jgi:single-stranded DNA-binding protein
MIGIESALVGTLTRDADHRTSKAGKPFTLLNIQVGDGDTRQYVSAIVFGDAATKVANLERGRHVDLEGKIEISEWTGADGTSRAGLKVMSFHAEEIAKIGRRRERKSADKKAANSASGAPAGNDFHSDEIPWCGEGRK